MVSIKKNLFYKGLWTFANYIIGFITFPYITRVLGPDQFGAINFTLNTVDYFLLFANMGVITIGSREIALCKDNIILRNKVFSRIFSLNVWFTIITLIVYYFLIYNVAKFNEVSNLMMVGSAKILLTLFAVEWLFTGLENFKFITIRNLIVKIIYIILVFLVIKSPKDTLLYLELTIGSIALASIINFIYSNKFVSLRLKECFSLEYFVPNLRMGFYTIMTSMYITFNVMFLGLVSNNLEVGYYSTAVKLYFIFISLFSAYTSVMMPRMTAWTDDNSKKFYLYLRLSFHLAVIIAVPIIVMTILLAPQLIYILSGVGYEEAVLPMRILMPALLLVWIAQVIVFQGLVPQKKDNILFIASILGGICSIILNLCLTKSLGSIGSAVVLLLCEVVVTSYYLFIVRRKKFFPLPSIDTFRQAILYATPFFIIAFVFSQMSNPFLAVGLTLVVSMLLSFILIKKEIVRVRQLIS